MRRILSVAGCLLWALSASVTPAMAADGAADGAPVWQPAVRAGVQQFDITSADSGHTYRILVRAPAGTPPPGGWPVLWMLDGLATFPVTEPFAGQPDSGARDAAPGRPGGLVVAVGYPSDRPYDSEGRARDYTPPPDAVTGDLNSVVHGQSAAFLAFLTGPLRDEIAGHYPIDRQRQVLFGHSYGGLFTLNTLLTEPQHFQAYWAASPSVWFSEAMIMRRLRAGLRPDLAGRDTPVRLVLSVGRDEQFPAQPLPPERMAHLARRAMVDQVSEAAALLADVPGLDLQLVVAADHDHHDMMLHGARRVTGFAFGEAPAGRGPRP